MSTVKMHGPTLDGSGTIVNRQVSEADVMAYRRAGYTDGFQDGCQTSEEYGAAKAKGNKGKAKEKIEEPEPLEVDEVVDSKGKK